MKFIVKILWGMLGFCVSIAFKNSATHAASWVAGPGFTVTAGDAVLRANCSISYGACTSASNNCSQFLGTMKNTMNSIVAGGYTYNGNVTNCSSGYYVSSYSPSSGITSCTRCPSNGHTINGARHMKSTTYGNSGCCNRSINAAFGMGATTSWYRIICSFPAQMFRDVDITDCYQSRGGPTQLGTMYIPQIVITHHDRANPAISIIIPNRNYAR